VLKNPFFTRFFPLRGSTFPQEITLLIPFSKGTIMRRFLCTALPLAALALLAGCCAGDNCPVHAASARPEPAVAAAKKTVPDREQGEIARGPEQAPARRPARPAAPRRIASRDGRIVIPTMPLPKGWNYMGEGDLRAN
jgi:hypothetical protein